MAASSLLGQVRWMKDGGIGPKLNDTVGGLRFDIAAKGQGHPDDFVKIMNFIIANKEAVGKLRIEVAHRTKTVNEANQIEYVKTIDWTGTAYDRYFKIGSDREALLKMVQDAVFGLDCIGFVSNYLIHVGLWSEYQGYEIDRWPTVFPKRITAYDDVVALCILIWPGSHIAIIDRVTDYNDDNKSCVVDVCQSSKGGPQTNKGVELKQSGGQFQFANLGKPEMPVRSPVTIHQMIGLRRVYQRGPEISHPAATSTGTTSQ